MTVRVVVADDEELVRTGLRMILEVEPGIEVVGEARDGRSAVELASSLAPDVLLMDVRMPTMDGLAATRELAAVGSPVRVVVLTTFDLDEYVHEALLAGAVGFLLKDAPAAQLVTAVRAAAAGDAVLAPSVTRRLITELTRRLAEPSPVTTPSAALASLTERELEVLRHLAQGLSNVEIARALYIGEGTVKTHVARILTKLGVRDRLQAVVAAHRAGLG